MTDAKTPNQFDDLADQFALDTNRLVTSYEFLADAVVAQESDGRPVGTGRPEADDTTQRLDDVALAAIRRGLSAGPGVTLDGLERLVGSLQASIAQMRGPDHAHTPQPSTLIRVAQWLANSLRLRCPSQVPANAHPSPSTDTDVSQPVAAAGGGNGDCR